MFYLAIHTNKTGLSCFIGSHRAYVDNIFLNQQSIANKKCTNRGQRDEAFNLGRNMFHLDRRNLDAKGQSVCDKALLYLTLS